MNIVVLDGYTENPGDLSWAPLEELGTLTVYDRTPTDDGAEIVQRLAGAEIAVTNKTPISREVLEGCPGLRCICVLATGYNVVDCPRVQCARLWHGGGGTVRHRHAAGDLPRSDPP